MSFFNLETTKKKKGGKAPINTKTLHRLECRACPLNKSTADNPKMDPVGSKHPDIYILGDAPSKDDDFNGEPFVGKAGKLLKSQIPNGKLKKIRFGNCVRTTTPKQRDPVWQELECCRSSVERDIERTKPKAIFGLGDVPLKWALNEAGIAKWRGRKLPVKIGNHVCWFYSFHHPEFIIQKGETKYRSASQSDLGRTFIHDMARAFKDLKKLETPKVETEKEYKKGIKIITGKNGKKDLALIKKTFADYINNTKTVGVDIEGTRLRPYYSDSMMLSIAIGTYKNTIAIALNHPGNKWGPLLKEVNAEIKRFLLDKRVIKIAHNLPFELEWLSYFYGNKIPRTSKWEDTMAQSYCLDERKGMMSLDILIRLFFGFNLKEISSVDVKNLINEPLEDVLFYNGLDAKYTHGLHKKQKVLLKEDNLIPIYKEQIRRAPTIALTQQRGVCVDQKIVRKFQHRLQRKLNKIETSILKIPVVKEYIKKYGDYNPQSNPQTVIIYRDLLKRKECLKINKAGHKSYSVDEEVLKQVKHSLSTNLLKQRGLAKLKSTYVDNFEIGVGKDVYPDGKAHSQLNSLFTATGRLCISGDTLLDTNLGTIAIESLDLTFTHKNAQIRTHKGNWKPITDLWYKGHEEMFRFRFSDGRYIDCTKGHQLLTEFGWQHTGSLKVGSKAIIAEGMGEGHNKRLPTSLFRKKQPINKSIKRIGFHKIGTALLQACKIIVENLWNNYKNNKTFKMVVFPTIRSSNKICTKSKFSKTDVWEQKRLQSPTNNSEQSFTPKLYKTGLAFKHNSQKTQSFLIHFKKKFKTLRIRKVFESPYKVYTIYGKGFINFRLGQSGDKRFLRTKNIFTKYGKCGTKFISFLFRTYIISPQNKKLMSQYWGSMSEWQGTIGLLVPQYWGNEVCSAFIEKESKTSQTMGAEGKWETKVHVRFLSAKIKNSNRGRWVDAFKTKKEGFKERGFCSEFWNSHIQNIRRTSPTNTGRLSERDKKTIELKSITPLGLQAVWDITVSDDHSYEAQGLIHHNSSEAFNQQNFPKHKDKWCRAQIVAPKGHILLSSDYGQIEARVIGMSTKDKHFCQALWEGYDIHMEWAERFSHEYPKIIGGKKLIHDKAALKELRQKVKNKMVFPAFFGANAKSIAGYMEVPDHVTEKLLKEFWNVFSDVKDWQDNLIDFYNKNGYVETLTGRRRRGPMTVNQLINHPIQGTASDIVIDAMNRISEYGEQQGKPQFQAIMNIHDDLTFQLPIETLDDDIDKIIDMKLDVPYDFINVPISIEMEYGDNWADMKTIGTFTSND